MIHFMTTGEPILTDFVYPRTIIYMDFHNFSPKVLFCGRIPSSIPRYKLIVMSPEASLGCDGHSVSEDLDILEEDWDRVECPYIGISGCFLMVRLRKTRDLKQASRHTPPRGHTSARLTIDLDPTA